MPSLRLLLSRSPLRALAMRTTTTTTTQTTRLARPYASSNNPTTTFQPGPSPPRLPAAEQAEFERLQRAAADRLADPTPLPHERPATVTSASTPAPSPASTPRHTSSTTTTTVTPPTPSPSSTTTTKEELPAGVWRGARPEFEGDKNPRTGEVGGPKTEPLRWGSGGDWSYNGRVTDF